MEHGFGGPEVPARRFLLVNQFEQLRCAPLVAKVDRAGRIHDGVRVLAVALVLRHGCEIAPMLPCGTELLVSQLQVFPVIRLVERVDIPVRIMQNRAGDAVCRNIVHDFRCSRPVVFQLLVCEQKRVVMLEHVKHVDLVTERDYPQMLVVDRRRPAAQDGESFDVMPVRFRIVDVPAVVLVKHMIKAVAAWLCAEVRVHVPGDDVHIAPYAASAKDAAAKVICRVTPEIPELSVVLPENVMPVVKIEHV